MRSVALVVVHYRTLRDTLECIESALALNVPDGVNTRLIVVDNASEDDSWEELLAWRKRHMSLWSREFARDEVPPGIAEASSIHLAQKGWEVVFLRAEENRGYAAGANLGLRFVQADPDVTDFWVLNSDLLLLRHSLAHLIGRSAKQPRAIYGVTLLYMDDPTVVQAAGGAVYLPPLGRSRHFGKSRHVGNLPATVPPFDYIVGAALFFTREVLEDIGPLPEHFFLYFEETEWCARALARGIELIWVPEAGLIHKEGKSTGAGGRFRSLSNLAFHYVVRNSLLFTEARHPFWLTTVFLFNIYESIRYCARGDFAKFRVLLQAVQEYWRLRPKWAREISAIGD